MEQSFELLCSMSPKIVMKKTPNKKGTSVLALKKNIRRSSVFSQKEPKRTTKRLSIVEILSSSESVSDFSESPNSEPRRVNAKTILICDSDDDDLSNDKIVGNNAPKSTLPKSKVDDILRWMDDLDKEKDIDTTAFSELSTILGDNLPKFQPKEKGHAVNSTLVVSTGKRLDELFGNKHTPNNDFCSDDETYHSAKNAIFDDSVGDSSSIGKKNKKKDALDVIEDSFDGKNGLEVSGCRPSIEAKRTDDFVKRVFSNQECDSNVDILANGDRKTQKGDIDSRVSIEKLEGPRKRLYSSKNLEQSGLLKNTPTNSVEQDKLVDDDVESILDSLYGDKWRKKQHLVLPNSEPRRNNHAARNIMPNTERKPKSSVLYRNPYLHNEFASPASVLLKKQTSQMESPCLARLRALCDPDTDSSPSPEKYRQKLDFSDDNAKCEETPHDRISKYFSKKTSLSSENSLKDERTFKENVDTSNLGESLEVRIQKKINNIKVVPSTKKKKTIEKKKNEESNQDKKKTVVKKKAETKTNSNKFREPRMSTSSCSSDEIDSNNRKDTVVSKTKKKIVSNSNSSSLSSDDEKFDQKIRQIHRSSLANGTYSFLESLSGNVPILRCDMTARIFRNSYSTHKDELFKRLFSLFNEKIFDNSIPTETALEWSEAMRKTAGFCYCRKITRRNGNIERTVRIVLSTKVVDSAYRLRDTLVHEMCHAATWIVNGVADGHGSFWKAWAYRAMKTFPELPPISRCHDYVINTKYTYRCTNCGYSIGRHSKSLDVERKRCGHCYGVFEVLVNKTTKKGEVKSVPSTPKQATGFALFVKENYGVYKNPDRKHGDVMKLLGQKFQELKVKNN